MYIEIIPSKNQMNINTNPYPAFIDESYSYGTSVSPTGEKFKTLIFKIPKNLTFDDVKTYIVKNKNSIQQFIDHYNGIYQMDWMALQYEKSCLHENLEHFAHKKHGS